MHVRVDNKIKILKQLHQAGETKIQQHQQEYNW